MKNVPLAPGVRDSYWRATQAELHSIQRRGEYLLVALVVATILGGIVVRERLGGASSWIFIAGAGFLSFFIAEVLYVASRKRRIAETRGLVCGQCSYTPHDTEINDVASARHCLRCGGEL